MTRRRRKTCRASGRRSSLWLGLLLTTLLTLTTMTAGMTFYALTPPPGDAAYPRVVSIPAGSSVRQAARDLERAGVLRQAWLFVWLARVQGRGSAIKAGSYAVSGPLSPQALLDKITQGDTVLGKLTVIEGWRFAEMRRAVDAHAGLRHDTRGLSDAALLARLGVDARHAEGRFFPDTYFFDHGSSDLALYRRAYSAMQETLAAAWPGRAAGLPYRDADDALIMASIIEKETGAPEERARIAAVFINRLRIGMRLQTDPTVIYGLGESFDGNLRRADLTADTPYNTYTRAGLPPTPIALPGEASILAALHPEPHSRALYFVASGKGRHVFSNSLDEHNRAVWRYQKQR